MASITLALLLVAGAGVWYKVWVEPRDVFLHAVMDCMNESGDMSRGSYNTCADEVISESR